MYNETKYIKWSDLSEEEKEKLHKENLEKIEEIEKKLSDQFKEQGFITYGDFLRAAGIWDETDIIKHPFTSQIIM